MMMVVVVVMMMMMMTVTAVMLILPPVTIIIMIMITIRITMITDINVKTPPELDLPAVRAAVLQAACGSTCSAVPDQRVPLL